MEQSKNNICNQVYEQNLTLERECALMTSATERGSTVIV